MADALIGDGRWFVPGDPKAGYVGDIVVVRWLGWAADREGFKRCRVQLCEDALLPGVDGFERRVKAGATRTIWADDYHEFEDDDYE